MFHWLSSRIKTGYYGIILRPNSQIPELDGLRSLAILLVISTHCAGVWPQSADIYLWILRSPFVVMGWVGVDLFFCLSGFLIGKQLWKEYQNTNTIHPLQFIFRRGLRIWPLYYSIFLIAIFLKLINGLPLSIEKIWPDLFLMSNYFTGSIVSGGWSLSTEEQFYLIIPLLLLLSLKILKKIDRGFWFIMALLLLPSIFRFYTWSQVDLSQGPTKELVVKYIYLPFHTHFDGLVIGLLLANLDARKLFKQNQHALICGLVVISVGIFSIIINKINHLVFGYLSLTMVFGSFIYYFLAVKKNIIGSLFSLHVFYIISRLSFGMYLIHFFILGSLVQAYLKLLPFPDSNINFIAFYFCAVFCTMILSFFSFSFIELPFLEFRNRHKARALSMDRSIGS